jgi:hypothetical protein
MGVNYLQPTKHLDNVPVAISFVYYSVTQRVPMVIVLDIVACK